MSTENIETTEREGMETKERNIFKRPGSKIWQVRYSVRGRKVQKSTGETSIAKARKFYENEIQHAKRAGRLAGLEESVTYEDVRELNKQHGKLLKTLEDSRLPNLDKYFANRRVVDIGAAMVAKYKAMRLTEEGSSLATVNRELAALRRMLNLAVDQEIISKATPPKI